MTPLANRILLIKSIYNFKINHLFNIKAYLSRVVFNPIAYLPGGKIAVVVREWS